MIVTALIAGVVSVISSVVSIYITSSRQRKNSRELEELKFQYEVLRKETLLEIDRNNKRSESKSFISESIQNIKMLIRQLTDDTLISQEQMLYAKEIDEIGRDMSGTYGRSINNLLPNEGKAIHDWLHLVNRVRVLIRSKNLREDI